MASSPELELSAAASDLGSDAELVAVHLPEENHSSGALRMFRDARAQLQPARWFGEYSAWLMPVAAGIVLFGFAMLGWQPEARNPIVLSNAFLSAMAMAATLYMGPRAAVAIGVAALAAGLLSHPEPYVARNFMLLLCLSFLSAAHPLAGAAIARRFLVRDEDVPISRSISGLLLSGPATGLLAAVFAGFAIALFTDLTTSQMLAALAKWWVVSAILIPLTVAMMVILLRSRGQSRMLSIQQMLPALATACFLVTLLVGVQGMQTREEHGRIRTALHDAAMEDISELTTDSSWIGGVESLLALQQYQFDLPAMDRYVESISGKVPGLLSVGWTPWDGEIDAPTAVPLAAATAMREAVRSGSVQVVSDAPARDGDAVTYTAYRASFPPGTHVAGLSREQRQAAALGVVVATYDLRKLFVRMQRLAVESNGEIVVNAPGSGPVLSLGAPVRGNSVADDIEVHSSVAVGASEWTLRLRQRAEIASISDISPSDVALSVISLLLGLGMAYATLDSLRRHRQVEMEVRRRTVNLARQIALRRHTEAALRNARDQLKSVFSAIPTPILIVDIQEGVVLDCNAATCRVIGVAVSDARGKTLDALRLPPLNELADVGWTGHELELDTPAGRRRYALTSSCVLVENRQAMLICFADITRLHEVEAGLRGANELLESRVAARTAELDASRNQIRAAMDHSPIGLAMVDLAGRWFDVNDSICQILGYSRDEMVKLDVYRISHPEDLDVTLAGIRALLSGHADAYSIEKRNLRKDGTTVWVQLDIAVVRNDDNRPVHFVAQIQNITDKRRKAEELRRAAAELASLNEALARERVSLAERVAERTAELRQANEVLKLATEKATLASRAKSEFVAVMSHEIRTPLNGVIGALDMLQAGQMRSEQRELVSMGFEAARSLLGIVDDILDFSRIEAGVVQLDTSEFTLEERLGSAVECLLPMARRLDSKLTLWVDPALPHAVLGDEMRVQQIVRNLVANALKFSTGLSRRGHVAVRATLAPDREDGLARVQISVQDNGIGMTPDTVARLFQPFTQGDQSTTRRFGGSGLGLSICARLAGLMGGRINVCSYPDAGSTFTLDFPLRVTAWSSQAARLQGLRINVMGQDGDFVSDVAATLRAQSAQIVDDAMAQGGVTVVDMASAEGDPLQKVLEGSNDRAGVVLLTHNGPRRGESVAPGVITLDRQVLGVTNLTEAVLMAAGQLTCQAPQDDLRTARSPEERPLILLVEDNPMNQAVVQRQLEMLGFQVAVAPDGEAGLVLWRQLRPTIILTDLHMPVMDGYGMMKRIQASGEPSTPPVIALTANASSEERSKCLAAGMSGYITKPVRAQVLKSVLDKWVEAGPLQANDTEAESRSTTAVHFPTLHDIAAGDPKLIHSLLETFVRMAEETMLDLQRSLGESDWTQIGEQAHKFKSSARTIGALQLGDLCEALEYGRHRHEVSVIRTAVDNIARELQRVLAEVEQRLDRNKVAAG